MRIDGCTALVTGAFSGLGLATAERLIAAGAKVVGIDLPSKDSGALEALGDAAVPFGADVTDEAGVRGAVEHASALGTLRIAVNCAGIGNAIRTVGRTGPFPQDEFERVVRVNLFGTFNVLRLTAEAISRAAPVDGERGVIVNTASIAAFDGQIGQAAYSASKAAVVGMTLPIARDLATQLIRVMTVAPGLMNTPLLGMLSEKSRRSLEQQIPHPSRLGEPSEFAQLVQAIVENPLLNGETIRMDSALRAGPR